MLPIRERGRLVTVKTVDDYSQAASKWALSNDPHKKKSPNKKETHKHKPTPIINHDLVDTSNPVSLLSNLLGALS